MSPQRIQRKRTKGWKAPKGAIYIGRPTMFGNPFEPGRSTHLWHRSAAYPYDFYRDTFYVVNREHAVRLYRSVLTDPEKWQDTPTLPDDWQAKLAGRDLMCWCPLDVACYGDVLLELANQ